MIYYIIRDPELEDEISKGNIVKCILVRDLDGKTIWAHMIPQKGVDEDNSCGTDGCLGHSMDWIYQGCS